MPSKMDHSVGPLTPRPFLMLFSLSAGFLVENSKTSFVFSGGTCLRII